MDSQGKTIDTFPINCPSSESYTKGIVDLNVNINHKFDKGRSMVLFSKSRDIHVIFLYSYMHIKIKAENVTIMMIYQENICAF